VLYPRAVELVRAPLEGLATAGRWHVLTWTSGAAATVERQMRDASTWCAEAGASNVQRLEGESHEAIWSSVREFGRGPDAVPCWPDWPCWPA